MWPRPSPIKRYSEPFSLTISAARVSEDRARFATSSRKQNRAPEGADPLVDCCQLLLVVFPKRLAVRNETSVEFEDPVLVECSQRNPGVVLHDDATVSEQKIHGRLRILRHA